MPNSEVYFADDFVTIHHGDCLDVMRAMEPSSVDAIVTDPPYGLGFMGRDWDHGVPGEHFWREALRVAKPGAHLVAFGGTRTYHRLAVAIEDAGWEIRDGLGWLYGSGFPKSLDVSKAIDKAAGAEREVVGMKADPRYQSPRHNSPNHMDRERGVEGGSGPDSAAAQVTAPATEAAERWQGWGTALKPAWEPIIIARKPLGMTVARCVQEHGTGALNIDGCRVGVDDDDHKGIGGGGVHERHIGSHIENDIYGDGLIRTGVDYGLGRWPANICTDGSPEVLAVFPQTSTHGAGSWEHAESADASNCYGKYGASITAQSGDSGSAARFFAQFPNGRTGEPSAEKRYTDDGASDFAMLPGQRRGDSGSAARFFYTAKATTAERDDGLHGEAEPQHGYAGTLNNGQVCSDGSTRTASNTKRRNTHPTVKPIALMRWLVRLVTPPDGIVLDPFMGSGTTLKAARAEGFKSIGVDLEADHCEIAKGRLSQGVLL